MDASKKLMAGALVGLLTLGTYAPTWANPPDTGTTNAPQAAVTPGNANRSRMGLLAPILTAPTAHEAARACKPDDLYSQHDVVGDPDSCFLNRLDLRGTGSMQGGYPGTF